MSSFIILLYMLTTWEGPAQSSLAPVMSIRFVSLKKKIQIYMVLGQLGNFLIIQLFSFRGNWAGPSKKHKMRHYDRRPFSQWK